jgi:hypothetical protein
MVFVISAIFSDAVFSAPQAVRANAAVPAMRKFFINNSSKLEEK